MPALGGGVRPLALVAASVAGGLLAVAASTRRYVDVVEVRGASMAPSLLPGDCLVVERWSYGRRLPRTGEIALAVDPRVGARELIKRVASIGPDGVTVLGDNRAASTDARAFGALPPTAVGWRVVLRYWPPSRFGRVSSSISIGSDPDAHELSGSPSRHR